MSRIDSRNMLYIYLANLFAQLYARVKGTLICTAVVGFEVEKQVNDIKNKQSGCKFRSLEEFSIDWLKVSEIIVVTGPLN